MDYLITVIEWIVVIVVVFFLIRIGLKIVGLWLKIVFFIVVIVLVIMGLGYSQEILGFLKGFVS